jgi:hypothetical protein
LESSLKGNESANIKAIKVLAPALTGRENLCPFTIFLPSSIEFFKEKINDCCIIAKTQSLEYGASDLIDVTKHYRWKKHL